jgi:hypothetical protein
MLTDDVDERAGSGESNEIAVLPSLPLKQQAAAS